VDGSPAVVQPQCAGETVLKDLLWRRHERTSSAHYIPYCNATFRSAALQMQPSFPVIVDPCDPTTMAGCPGVKGDIQFGAFEHIQIFNKCEMAWDQLGFGDVGVLAVNIRRFVDGFGNPIGTLGAATETIFCDSASQAGAELAVIDNDFSLPLPGQPVGCVVPEPYNDPNDSILGHEMGHTLSLPHTSGNPVTLMKALFPLADFLTSGGAGQTDTVCPNPVPPGMGLTQCGRVRLQGMCHVNGVQVDPPPVVDSKGFPAGDVSPEHVDLRQAGLVDDAAFRKASVFWEAGLFPSQAQGIEFAFAADLDADPATGGDPLTLGLPVPLAGAELAGLVRVDADTPLPSTEKQFSTTDRLWRFSGGAFAPAPTLGSRAIEVDLLLLQEDPPELPSQVPWATNVALSFDRTYLEIAPSLIATAPIFQVSATDTSITALTPVIDLPPSVRLHMAPPALPGCVVAPEPARPGESVTVTAEGLTPGQSTHVLFGTSVVAMGLTDGDGRTASTFIVPPAAAPGRHLVTIGVDDPADAITADCTVGVMGAMLEAGSVPDGNVVPGAPLTATWAAGELTLSWGDSCLPADIDYEIYEGSLGDFTTHASIFCSTGGATMMSFVPAAGNAYYLVLPSNGLIEGSYGRSGDGFERPAGVFPCRPQRPAACP